MRNLSIAFVLVMSLPSTGMAFSTVDMSAVANARFDTPGFINGNSYPTAPSATPDNGIVTLDGVPYFLPSTGNYMWHSELATGANPRTANIAVGVFGADEVYALMGTWWGERSAGSYASIEFFGDGGAYYKMDLEGGAEIRDYNYNPSFTTTLNTAVTKEVWANGSGVGTQHIDRQLFDLPDSFMSQTLDHIIVSDNGGGGFQRTFVAAVTVSAVPEPQTYSALLVGLGLVGFAARRRRV